MVFGGTALVPGIPNTGILFVDQQKDNRSGHGGITLAECKNGDILVFTEEEHLPAPMHVFRNSDHGKSWRDEEIVIYPDGAQHRDYKLMGGLVRLPLDEHDILLFSNIDSPEGRRNGTIWASFDGGKTWPVKRLVEEGGFAYSSMAAGREGTPSEGWIYLMYEGGGHPDSKAYIARFNLAWVTGGRDWREFIK